MLTTLTHYRLVTRDIGRSLGTIAADRLVVRERAYYEAKIGSIKSIDQFMADQRIYGFALKALGLGEMTGARALIRKVLEGGIDARNSLANSFSDPRFRQLAEHFNFVRYGTATTSFERAQKGIVDRYLRLTLEENAGQSNEGVRIALYFERKASTVSSVYDFLADPALYKFVQTAFNLPAAMSASSVDKQAELLRSRIEVSDLKDPKKLARIVERFAVLWDVSADNNQRSSAATPVQTAASPLAISSESMIAIQNLSLGRR